MADDLEAFLRQAAQRRAQKAAGMPQPAAPPQRPAAPTPPRAPSPPQAKRPTARPTQPAAPTAEVVEAEVVSVDQVARFKTRVDTSSIANHAQRLGEEVGQADEHMEAHLSRSFDHQVGSQVTPQQPGLTTGGDTAFDVEALLEMLTKPISARNAIVLSEILRRPDFD